MRCVFFGTPDFAARILRRLAAVPHLEIAGVVTRLDAVSKRGKTAAPSPVALAAAELGLPVKKLSSLAAFDTDFCLPRVTDTKRPFGSEGFPGGPYPLEDNPCADADVFIVAAFGLLLPPALLTMPRRGCVNVHASLLPRWRGAAPIERAMLAGDPNSGVSIMRMEAGLDTGPYCARAAVPIGDTSADELRRELAELGATLLLDSLPAIADGSAEWTAQDLAQVTYAQKIAKGELNLSPEVNAEMNLRRVRASSASAPAKCCIAGTELRVTAARVGDAGGDRAEVSKANGRGRTAARLVARSPQPPDDGAVAVPALRLTCTDGSVLEVLRLQPAGKREMAAADWLRGLRLPASSATALISGATTTAIPATCDATATSDPDASDASDIYLTWH
ncbi:MAG: methionyl-tRNA formyltransferase [Actinomycetes bacterium]|jgi:methionyl-tRNA formyltransferase|nr:methionyl-tRNA formyltransferase [Actinomycetes bacterium]